MADVRRALRAAVGRRDLLRAASVLGAAGAATAAGAVPAAAAVPAAPGARRGGGRGRAYVGVLQPGRGPIDGEHYLASTPQTVRWGYVPALGSEPVLEVADGATLTVDTVSHEGLLEDQGRDPVAWFGARGVARDDVLDDAVDIAAGYARTRRRFDVDGPHVVTGPVFVRGAQPGDVLKVETLSALLRVPYGVVSSRHGKGALPRLPGGGVPSGITLAEVMPPYRTDDRASGVPARYGNVSVFTPVVHEQGRLLGVMPRGDDGRVSFPVTPFLGMLGVAFEPGDELDDPSLNSVPPNLGGGNIDIRRLTVGSALYLPVTAEGALFYTGDPHMAMGNGEVALTAMEGSLRATFRLSVCKPGSGDAPSVAFRYPFAESEGSWVAVGLSDPGRSRGSSRVNDLNIAMRRCVVNALDFLETDLGMDRGVAYAYLSAAADLEVSQVVDRTVGVHLVIRKADFEET